MASNWWALNLNTATGFIFSLLIPPNPAVGFAGEPSVKSSNLLVYFGFLSPMSSRIMQLFITINYDYNFVYIFFKVLLVFNFSSLHSLTYFICMHIYKAAGLVR